MRHFLIEQISDSNRFATKESRARKLLERWHSIYDKMMNMIERGSNNNVLTEQAQCAWAVAVMMQTGIRVGNEKSAEGYICINAYKDQCGQKVQTYGLTTLLAKHCYVLKQKGQKYFVMNFVGKKLEDQKFFVQDPLLLFCGELLLEEKHDEDRLLSITHYDLTKFVKKHIGKNFTIKDIRTAKVNDIFIYNTELILLGNVEFEKKSQAKKFANTIVEQVAEKIGHTKNVCKRSYISQKLFLYTVQQLERKYETQQKLNNA